MKNVTIERKSLINKFIDWFTNLPLCKMWADPNYGSCISPEDVDTIEGTTALAKGCNMPVADVMEIDRAFNEAWNSLDTSLTEIPKEQKESENDPFHVINPEELGTYTSNQPQTSKSKAPKQRDDR